jgi:hypothetical protein
MFTFFQAQARRRDTKRSSFTGLTLRLFELKVTDSESAENLSLLITFSYEQPTYDQIAYFSGHSHLDRRLTPLRSTATRTFEFKDPICIKKYRLLLFEVRYFQRRHKYEGSGFIQQNA